MASVHTSRSKGLKHLLHTEHLSADTILSLFRRTKDAVAFESKTGWFRSPDQQIRKHVVSLVFFEPSTRTRMSFQMATKRLGYSTINMVALDRGSSIEKGETITDTAYNVLAMRPNALVIRYGNEPELDEILPKIDIPVISAGSGVNSHPTQALLDSYTIWDEFGQVEGKKVFVFGDIKHSRVARSNFDILGKLGAKIGVFGPAEWLPGDDDAQLNRWAVQRFETMEQGLMWADAVMGLRVQNERHEPSKLELTNYDFEGTAGYHSRYGLGRSNLNKVQSHAIIMHPGPINRGYEFDAAVFSDPRNRILKQVENGVAIRAMLLKDMLEGTDS